MSGLRKSNDACLQLVLDRVQEHGDDFGAYAMAAFSILAQHSPEVVEFIFDATDRALVALAQGDLQ